MHGASEIDRVYPNRTPLHHMTPMWPTSDIVQIGRLGSRSSLRGQLFEGCVWGLLVGVGRLGW